MCPRGPVTQVSRALAQSCSGHWRRRSQKATSGDSQLPQSPALRGCWVAMDLYLSNCLKAAEAAASKAASDNLTNNKDTCSTVSGGLSTVSICSLPFFLAQGGFQASRWNDGDTACAKGQKQGSFRLVWGFLVFIFCF